MAALYPQGHSSSAGIQQGAILLSTLFNLPVDERIWADAGLISAGLREEFIAKAVHAVDP